MWKMRTHSERYLIFIQIDALLDLVWRNMSFRITLLYENEVRFYDNFEWYLTDGINFTYPREVSFYMH
jgi:hypothetical protein